MTFSVFANHMNMNESNVADFVVEIVDAIMEDPPTDVDAALAAELKYNPFQKLASNSREAIYSGRRPFSQANARKIHKHLDKQKFEQYVDRMSFDSRSELCRNLEPYVGNATADEIGSKCADLFVSVIVKAANFPTAPAILPVPTAPAILSNNVDSLLLTEVSMRCPLCGNLLMRKISGQTVVGDYRVTEIYPSAPTHAQSGCIASISKPTGYILDSIENKTVLCLTCNNDYLSAFTPILYNLLRENKLAAVALFDAITRIDNIVVERSLTDVVKALANISDVDLSSLLRFEALKVDGKVLPSNVLLKNKIKTYATQFYLYIEELLAEEAKEISTVGDRLPKAIQYVSDELIASGLSQSVVFSQLTEWIKNKTNSSDDLACEILVSFFVQNCEVFYEIS